MTSFSVFLILIGVMLIGTRGPFLFAPETTRQFYLSIIGSKARMRIFGVAAALIGASFMVTSNVAPVNAAGIAFYFGLAILVLAITIFFLSSRFHKMAKNIWSAFSGPVLRAIGILSVLMGGVLIWYALSL